jgi:anti-anti-sigma regulatory factor
MDPARPEAASLEGLFQGTVDLIPLAFRDPEAICARARIADRSFQSKSFRETPWVIAQNILVDGKTVGTVEVYCREEPSPAAGGPFSKGKRYFLEIVAARLGELVRRGLAEDAERRVQEELREKLDVIEAHRNAIRDLSTPVLEVWDRVLLVPLIGTMDSARTSEVAERTLEAVTRKRARFVIVDITGVQVVDTAVANHLVGMASAVKMLGASCILTGMGLTVVQTMVGLGIDLHNIKTAQSLEDGLRECLQQMGAARIVGLILTSIFRT